MNALRAKIVTAKPKNLLKLNQAVVREFLASFDTVLCDCDGVIFVGSKGIYKSVEAVKRLKKLGKQIYYVSNNCTLSIGDFNDLLYKFGIEAEKEDVVIPTVAIIDYLIKIGFKEDIYLIGLNKMKDEFKRAGLKIADYGPGIIEEHRELFDAELKDDESVGAVVMDIDINMTYLRLQKALIYLMRKDVIFVTAGSDDKIPFERNITLIGPSYFQAALSELSGKKPLKFGKPSLLLNDYVSSKFKLIPERTLFIGDSFSDMVFASDGQYQKLMVLSGNVTMEDIEDCQDENKLPTYYLEKLGDFCRILDDLQL